MYLFVLVGVNFARVSIAAEEGWKSASKISREIRRMEGEGMIPKSLACRNQPGVTNRLKPQAKVSWMKNVSKREWSALIYMGHLNFMPWKPGQVKKWRRIYKMRFSAGASGAIFNCTLWYKR